MVNLSYKSKLIQLTTKITVVIVLFLSTITINLCQPGFNKIYDFDYSHVLFFSSLVDDDTIIACGPVIDSQNSRQGIILAKIDSFGSILDYKTYFDTLGRKVLLSTDAELIKTSDQGYAIVGGGYFGVETQIFIKFNENLNVEFVSEAPDSTVRSIISDKIIELNSGYLIAGEKQYSNYTTNIYVNKIDKEGNFVWERYYGDDDTDESLGDVVKIGENDFYLAGSFNEENDPIYRGAPMLIHIDSFGNQLYNEWTGESSEDAEDSILDLLVLQNGDLLYTSSFGYINNTNHHDYGSFPTVVRRGHTITHDLIWSSRLNNIRDNGFAHDVKEMTDGNFIIAGIWYDEVPGISPEEYVINGGRLYAISPTGDKIWSRADTVLFDPSAAHDSVLEELYSVNLLSSGSIIAAGYVLDLEGPGGYYGWIIKVDKNGCMEYPCDVSTSIKPDGQIESAPEVHPNPSTGPITINTPFDGFVQVFNSQGQAMVMQDIEKNETVEIILTSPGVYFIQFKDEFGKAVSMNKVVIIK